LEDIRNTNYFDLEKVFGPVRAKFLKDVSLGAEMVAHRMRKKGIAV